MKVKDYFSPKALSNKLEKQLIKRKDENNFRQINLLPESKIDFFSNDYLGISRNWSNYINNDYILKGSTGSRLLSGNSKEAINCEKSLADFYNSESAIVFNSGYDANIGLISTIISRDDIVLYDEKIHASIRDGIVLSRAKAYSFLHNNIEDLVMKINKFSGNEIYVIVESIYSMDGEISPLKEIATICENNYAKLIVDEAHSGGIFGNNGKGLCNQEKIENKVFARLITFSKAYGFFGAAVLCDEKVKQYLVNFCRSFIYTTALPASHCEIIKNLVELNLENERKSLFKIIERYNKLFNSKNYSPIQFLKLNEISDFNLLQKNLNEIGIFQKVIKYPTVSKDNEGIRLCLHSFNTLNEVELLNKQYKIVK